MRPIYSSLLLFFFLKGFIVSAQELYATILDLETKRPIPYASVLYNSDRGVITNEEGRFSLIYGEKISSLAISSMGYETLELKPSEIGSEIFLKPTAIQLQEVFLTNKKLSGREIMEKAKEAVAANYDFDLTHKRFFFRESSQNTVNRFDLMVEESTIEGIDQHLLNEISQSIPKETGSYKEVLGDFYGNYEKQKLKITKAANLDNPSSSERLEALTGELERLFKQNLKTHSYLKVRSGLIGVKVDAEDLEEEWQEEKIPVEKSDEDRAKELAERKKGLYNNANSDIQKLLGSMFWKEDGAFDVFDKLKKYEFVVNGFTQLDNEPVYKISFSPRRGAAYRGIIYVNSLDFGVHRLEFENIKPLKKFRLFGLTTAEDVYCGKMIFIKDGEGKYQPRYLEQKRGESFGLDRPLTIIEKNKVVPGRNKQNELDLELDLSFSQVATYQFVIYDSERLESDNFENIGNTGEFQFETFKAYNPEYWEGQNIIEPNAAIKNSPPWNLIDNSDF